MSAGQWAGGKGSTFRQVDQKKFDEKSITGREINKFEYIPFNTKTTKFCKIHSRLNFHILLI
jgi:hypothetical protein